jgi:hypothetical protein
MGLTVTELWSYPVKGCAGVNLRECGVGTAGLRWDRSWMVVNATTGSFITQRQKGKLALVTQQLPLGASVCGAAEALSPDAALVLNAPGQPPLLVQLEPPAGRLARRTVSVWEWSGEVRCCGGSVGGNGCSCIVPPGSCTRQRVRARCTRSSPLSRTYVLQRLCVKGGRQPRAARTHTSRA